MVQEPSSAYRVFVAEMERRRPNPSPKAFDTALRAVEAILADSLKRFQPETASLVERAAFEDLAVALEELRVVSEELHAQIAHLQRERELTAHLFDLAPYPFFITDLFSNIVEVNRAAVAFLGVLPHRLLGRALVSSVADSERRDFRDRLNHLVAVGEDTWANWRTTLKLENGVEIVSVVHARLTPYEKAGARIFWIVRAVDS